MIEFRSLSNNRGIAIIAVTLVVVVGALLGGAIIAQTSQDVELTDRVFTDKQALFIAESGKEKGYQEIFNDNTFTTLGNPGTLTGVAMMGGSYDIVATTLSDPPKIVQVVSTSTASGITKQVTVIAEVLQENVNVWNNAIFGGSGQSGGVINGNCAIHGSVHLLGENVGSGNNSIEAIDLSGTSLIHNNYEGMPADLRAKVPGILDADLGIDTLKAKLRVKNGAVGVSGNSEIGEADIVGNSYKETMDGIYIETDYAETRWTGNQVTDGVPNPDNVRSDNGTNALYDLANMVHMPIPNDPYPGYTDYDDFFSSNSLHLPGLVLDDSNSALNTVNNYSTTVGFPAGISVVVNGDGFSIVDANQGNKVIFGYDPNAAAGGNGLLTMDGMIQIDGDLVVGEKNFDIFYDGRATIYASGTGGVSPPSVGDPSPDDYGNVDVHSNLLPVTTFPTVDVIGLMSRGDMNLATGSGDSQLSMAGAFYAQNRTTSAKQNQIAGTFVCNFFDMGTNVPKIYQAPSLVDNLPPGIIGADPIWVVTGFEERSWQVE
jgi:hypothetical protein